jgi:hypothetical protein
MKRIHRFHDDAVSPGYPPFTSEAERGGSVRDDRETELAEERGVPRLVVRFQGREALPK